MCVLLSQDTQQGSLLKALFELIQFMAPDRGIKGVTGVVGVFWLFDSAFLGFLVATLLEVILGGCQDAECRGDVE